MSGTDGAGRKTKIVRVSKGDVLVRSYDDRVRPWWAHKVFEEAVWLLSFSGFSCFSSFGRPEQSLVENQKQMNS